MAPVTHSIPVGEFVCQNQQETFDLGVAIGQSLVGGEILLLKGPLGAGKTLLIKGIGAALGIDDEDVTSPSFTLVNPYQGRLQLYHIDLYRLDQGASAAHAVDLDEILADEKAVVAIEWADRMGRYRLPPGSWTIAIEGDGDARRLISISR